jgi:hypothetical protein
MGFGFIIFSQMVPLGATFLSERRRGEIRESFS